MEKLIIEFVIGFILIGIVSTGIVRQLQKEAVFSKKNVSDKEILSDFILIIFVFLSFIKENNDILMGILLGNSLIQLLVIGGINKLLLPEEKGKQISLSNLFHKNRKEYRLDGKSIAVNEKSSIHYLIFCIILLLFLSADYLLRKDSVQNKLSQIDGGILILLYILFCYTMRREDEVGIFQKIKTLFRVESEKEILFHKGRKKYYIKNVFIYILLIINLTIGGIFIIDSFSKIGIEFNITQYAIGLTGIVWIMNFPIILLRIIENGKNSEKMSQKQNRNINSEIDYFEKATNKIIFSFTLVLGIITVIRPIIIIDSIIYDLIFYAIILLFIWLLKKIDNRLAGSSLTTVYIVYVVSVLIR